MKLKRKRRRRRLKKPPDTFVFQRLSPGTRQRLIAFAKALHIYEMADRNYTFRSNGTEGTLSVAPPLAIIRDYYAAQDDLANCPEPEVQELYKLLDFKIIDHIQDEDSKLMDVEAAGLSEEQLSALVDTAEQRVTHKMIIAGNERRIAKFELAFMGEYLSARRETWKTKPPEQTTTVARMKQALL
jgi:hypothetical protein